MSHYTARGSLAGCTSHRCCCFCSFAWTYADEKHGHGREDGSGKGEGDDLGGVLGIGAEDVVNLGALPVAQGRLVGGAGVGVALDVDVKDGRDNGLGGAKGTEDNLGLERLLRLKELDGEVLLRL